MDLGIKGESRIWCYRDSLVVSGLEDKGSSSDFNKLWVSGLIQVSKGP